MKGEYKNIFKVASIYITTIIGAGFASGQEIMQFFSNYHRGGFYGIIAAGILFALIGYVVLDKVYKERIRDYDEFLFPTVGWFFGWVMEIVVTLFLLSIFSIMIAGLGSILSDKLDISLIYGVMIMTLVCMMIILTDIKGVMALSTILTPVMIIGIIGIGLYVIIFKDTSVFSVIGTFGDVTDNWLFSSLIYVSYNSIMSVVVMCSLLPYLKTRKVGIVGGVAGGLVLCVIAFILNTALFMFYPEVISQEFPVLNIVERYSNSLSSFYTFILWLAMFTSAVTAGYCFVDRVRSKIKVNSKLITIAVSTIIIPMSCYGFSNLITAVYPVFGYLGLFMVFAILIQGVRIKFLPSSLSKKRKLL